MCGLFQPFLYLYIFSVISPFFHFLVTFLLRKAFANSTSQLKKKFSKTRRIKLLREQGRKEFHWKWTFWCVFNFTTFFFDRVKKMWMRFSVCFSLWAFQKKSSKKPAAFWKKAKALEKGKKNRLAVWKNENFEKICLSFHFLIF